VTGEKEGKKSEQIWRGKKGNSVPVLDIRDIREP